MLQSVARQSLGELMERTSVGLLLEKSLHILEIPKC
jgi:hypothetical protein